MAGKPRYLPTQEMPCRFVSCASAHSVSFFKVQSPMRKVDDKASNHGCKSLLNSRTQDSSDVR